MSDLERYAPSINGRIAYEHLHRYAVAKDYVADARVLDIACGEGYGSYILSSVARHVTALDNDAATIATARGRYSSKNRLDFIHGDAAKIAAEDASFDVVVSFETIEHLADVQGFLKEVKRVLKQGGLLLISSPNEPEYNQSLPVSNPHHLQEYDLQSFDSILSEHFDHREIHGQRMFIASSIAPMPRASVPNEPEYRAYTGEPGGRARLTTAHPGVARLTSPEYFLCFCSDTPISHPVATDSVFVMPDDDLWLDHRRIMAWASKIHEEDEVLRRGTGDMQAGLAAMKHKEESLLQQIDFLEQLRVATSLEGASLARVIEMGNAVLEQQKEISESLMRKEERTRELLEQAEAKIIDLEGKRKHMLADDLSVLKPLLTRFEGGGATEPSVTLLTDVLATAWLNREMAQRQINDLTSRLATGEADHDRLAAAHRVEAALESRLEDALAKLDRERVSRESRERDLCGQIATLTQLRDDHKLASARWQEVEKDWHERHADLARQLEVAEEAKRASSEQATAADARALALADDLHAATTARKEERDASNTLIVHLREKIVGREQAYADLLTSSSTRYEALESEFADRQLRLVAMEEAQRAAIEQALVAQVYAQELENDLTDARNMRWELLRRSDDELRNDFGDRQSADSVRLEPHERDLSDRRDAHAMLPTEMSAGEHALRLELERVEHRHNDHVARMAASHQGFREEWASKEKTYKRDLAAAKHSNIELQAIITDISSKEAILKLKEELTEELSAAGRQFHDRLQQQANEVARVPLTALEHGDELCERLFFDAAFYHDGPDPGDGDVDGLQHYLDVGWREGRSPCALFDGNWYLVKHPGVLEMGISPLSHYVRHGASEGLQPHPCFDRAFYVSRYPDSLRHGNDPYQHFVRQGLQAGCFPSARIEAAAKGQPAIAVLGRILDQDLQAGANRLTKTQWPPRPLQDYWLPQALRDYIQDEFGHGPIDLMSYLFSVIASYENKIGEFAESEDLALLIKRARAFKQKRAKAPPDVSIIIPVYNNIIYTVTSIISILEHRTRWSFEILVGDDLSTDATPRVVRELGRAVELVRHATNHGFLQNCNACAGQAAGRYLVFLNNDTLILPGWLDELIAPLEEISNVGLTGSKLINGDGTLQEAGGIAWDDGTAWNYGRGADPRLPHFSYSKDVDYCSGASLGISKVLWDQLGGFDLEFAPAYNEDSDLAFRVRAAGSRTYFAASSILIHHEGRSHGRDVGSGVKAYQSVNQAKFFKRWRSVLARENFPNATNLFLARDRSKDKPHILIVDHYIPQWDRDAGSRTMLHFIRMFLNQGFHVTFWPDNLHHDHDYAKPLQDMGVEIIYGPQYVGKFQAWLADVAETMSYILLSRPQIAEKYIGAIDRSLCKVLYYGHDLHWKRLEKQCSVVDSDALRTQMEAMRELELAVCRKSDLVLYPSAEEIAVLRPELSVNAAMVAVPAWCFTALEIDEMFARARKAGGRDPAHVMFVGGFNHGPNVDGVLWFATQVWPLIKERFPSAKLTIAGSNPPDSIKNLIWTIPSVSIVGFINDAALDKLYRQANVAVIPLRFGGGVKGKLIEAFAKGISVVTTATGVQGVPEPTEVAYIADEPELFAEHVVACLEDPMAGRAKALAAVEFLAKSYSIPALVDCLRAHVPELTKSGSSDASRTRTLVTGS